MTFNWTVVFAILLAAELVGYAAAATYVVGDGFGWGIPQDGGATYANYASQHVFTVGDVLVFNFTNGEHDVARVTKSAYDECISSNPLFLYTVGPASVTLNTAGADYYICTFGQHCSLGQKLAINVTASETSPSPSPSPSPAQAPPPTPPSTTPSPTPIVTPPVSSPSPAPGGIVTPPAPTPAPGSMVSPPAPTSGIPPGTPSTPPPTSELNPPPLPSSAPVRTSYTALSVATSMIIGLIMM